MKFYYVPLSGAAGGGGLVDTIPMNTGGEYAHVYTVCSSL